MNSLVDTLHKGEISVCLSLSLSSHLCLSVCMCTVLFFFLSLCLDCHFWLSDFNLLQHATKKCRRVKPCLVRALAQRNEDKEIAHPFRVALHGGAHENLRSITRFSTLSRIYSRIVIVKEVTVFGDNVFSHGGGLHQIWTRFGHQVIRCHFHRYLG